ncbi:HECT-like ubiquitin-conjugating enzyme-binding-domain-containing protein [Phlebopus sp. FC_14]|nr:HECT-like ubiquitin-conjugating enzyme-binding-domain-containing protein [Phlebopus sp. FC_14]
MATLARPRTHPEEQPVDGKTEDEHDDCSLQRTVPAPFPVERLIEGDDILDDLAAESVEYDVESANPVLPSIEAVQQSCLMTLTNLLSVSFPPLSLHSSRRHSTPSLPTSAKLRSTSANPFLPPPETHSTADVASLVYILRSRDGGSTPAQPKTDSEAADKATPLEELHDLVDALAPSMDRRDAHLAQAIVALLVDLERLPPTLASTPAWPASPDRVAIQDGTTGYSSHVLLSTLQRQLSSLQPIKDTSSPQTRTTPIEAVQTALLWTRIDEQLETVLALCKDRAACSSTSRGNPVDQTSLPSSGDGLLDDNRAQSFDGHLPPRYEAEFPYPYDLPPSYVADPRARTSLEEKGAHENLDKLQYPPEKVPLSLPTPRLELPPAEAEQSSSASFEEKSPTTVLDLELVTRAIDRLYVVAPQLADQRVELKREKILEMEKAREGKGKARASAPSAANGDVELDVMLDLLRRASAREIVDQSVIIDPRRRGRSKGDLEEQRKLHFEDLVRRSSVGRLHDQDAVQRSRHAVSGSIPSLTALSGLISGGDNTSTSYRDDENRGRASDSEGVKHADAKLITSSFESTTVLPMHKKSRSRSLSASHLAWLKPASKEKSSKAKDVVSSTGDRGSSSISKVSQCLSSISGRNGGVAGAKSVPTGGGAPNSGALDVAYVAEHHETLRHVLIFITVAGFWTSTSSSTLSSNFSSMDKPTAEVLPSTSSAISGDWLLLRFAGKPSPPLILPVPVIPGQKELLVQSGHWEVKVECAQGALASEHDDSALLTAHQLTSLSPATYTCFSCTLPLVLSPPLKYRDLPSEHWEELVDAWMCHPEEQKLAKGGMNGSGGKGGFGFWPGPNEGLVGASYVLFGEEAVVRDNVTVAAESEHSSNSYLMRCLCGAVIGKCHEKRDNHLTMRMYRLFKYALRPMSATAELLNIPMSAFVVQDMLEHVQAHATYRFVLSDEEDEKPRLLIWLFKPKIRLSYLLPASCLFPESGSIEASKVLYKILGPASATTDIRDLLKKYPGFPQAEYLFYPMDVCRKLACLLAESTQSYPENLRTMTGLDVGWLRRA